MVAEAGCLLANIHKEAEKIGRLFPLRLASEGSAQLGGLAATNAGGHHVLRYGMMRELVAGLEIVLADGSIWNGLSALKKDNSGYDLKDLFIGSEGTLGIITALSLRLKPQEGESAIFMVGLDVFEQAVELFYRADAQVRLTAYWRLN